MKVKYFFILPSLYRCCDYSCVSLARSLWLFFFFFFWCHWLPHTRRLHLSLNLADLSSRAESRCTCVPFPGSYSQGLQCTSAWVLLLVHTRRTFACIVINSICSGSPRLQGYGWITEEGQRLRYLFTDLLIFTVSDFILKEWHSTYF